MVLVLAWHPVVVTLVTLAFLLVCLLMVLTVLIQKPQGGGLSGAFGSGAGSGQTAFGTKTGDALTIFTIIVFVVWLLLAIVLNFASRPQAFPTAPPILQSTDEVLPPVDPDVGGVAPSESTATPPPENSPPAQPAPASETANPAADPTSTAAPEQADPQQSSGP